jgi:tetratricopeptide (TPR) repeat protein
MLGYGWLTVRQVQEALKQGRLDEAVRLLNQPAAQGHRRAEELRKQAALALAERGERHLRRDDPEPAWADLVAAESLAVTDTALDRLRQALTRLGLAQVRAQLEAGEPGRATEAAGVLRDRAVRQPELQPLEEAARDWLKARDLADRGEFALARQVIDRVRRMSPAIGGLERFATDLDRRHGEYQGLQLLLHDALDRHEWREVIRQAEAVLAVAPHHADVRKARTKAWRAIEPETIAAPAPAPVATIAPPVVSVDGAERLAAQPRFLLWIDHVGGFLVCLGRRVTLGQSGADAGVDVPLLADVSRVHAALTRDPEGYLLEPIRSTQVNGRPVTETTLLRHGDRLTLGPSCQLSFRQPAPVSATARLDLASGHRLPFAVDGVLLMADTLILGPGEQAHVTVPDLPQAVVLYRHKDGLGVRLPGDFTCDGRRERDRALLGPAATVNSEALTFSVEPLNG